jgi:hypothetical protein
MINPASVGLLNLSLCWIGAAMVGPESPVALARALNLSLCKRGLMTNLSLCWIGAMVGPESPVALARALNLSLCKRGLMTNLSLCWLGASRTERSARMSLTLAGVDRVTLSR